MTLKCGHCNQTILPTDSVCWHCGNELKSQQAQEQPPEKRPGNVSEERQPISITAVSVFALITLITIILFIVVTNALVNST